MRKTLGGIGGAAIVGVGLVAGVSGPAAVAGTHALGFELTANPTALFMGGLGFEDVDENLMARVLGGRYASGYTLVGLEWPGQIAPFQGTLTLNQSVQAGIDTMMEAIRTTDGVKIVGGASGSTLVVNEVMRRLADDPNAPPKNELSFMVLGDADRGVFKPFRGATLPTLDYPVRDLPVSQYDIMVVTGEYDGLGDWPDRSWNLLAVLNAMAGTGLLQQVINEEIVDQYKLDAWGSVHFDAMFEDLATVPEKNITVRTNAKGGVTTTYVVPTADLPLLRPLKPLGVPQPVIDVLESVLRPVIDSAYVRNDSRFQPIQRPGERRLFGTAAASASPVAAVPPSVRASVSGPAPARASVAAPRPARLAPAAAGRPAKATARVAAQRADDSGPTTTGRG